MMETAVILIMLMAALSFVLRLTFLRPPQMLGEAVVLAIVTVSATDIAAGMSKADIAAWMQTPGLTLDLAVIVTLDVALQIAFCFRMVDEPATLKGRVARALLLYIPGLLIYPAAIYALALTIFSCPGVDFYIPGYCLAASIALGAPALAIVATRLLPDRDGRLELIFYISCLTELLGIIATIEGRVTTAGASEVNIPSMMADIGLAAAGALCGYLFYRKKYKSRI